MRLVYSMGIRPNRLALVLKAVDFSNLGFNGRRLIIRPERRPYKESSVKAPKCRLLELAIIQGR